MRGIHPKPYAHGLKITKLHEHVNQKNLELAKMVLPKISHRNLDDLMDPEADNPFKVQRNTEKLLRFRERQRELEKLEAIKHKIEHKYMYGQDLLSNMAKPSNPKKAIMGMDQDRTGLLRQINKIPPMPMPEHLRSQSVRPERNASKHQKSKSLFQADNINLVPPDSPDIMRSPRSSV